MRTAARVLATLLLISTGCTPIFGQISTDVGAPLLRLKSGKHYASTKVLALDAVAENSKESVHFIAIFGTIPNATDANNLRDRGYGVFSVVPDNGLLVYGDPAMNLASLGVVENYLFHVKDKLSAKLDSSSTQPLTVVLGMQPDAVSPIVWLRLLIAGIILLPNQDLNASELLAQAPFAALQEVAGWDDVAYIYPASPQMISGQKVVPCAMGNSGKAGLAVAANLVPTFGDGWAGPSHGAANIAYALHSTLLPLPEADVGSATQAVLAEWSSYAAITFTPTTQVDSSGSIDILFASGDHGDGFPFKPSGGVLAHTFYPPPNPEPIAGDMHVNYDEAWSTNGSLQLYAVMLHEMGHALGLGHSDDPDDVMYPYYQATQHLAAGDIAALQTLYAAPTLPVTPAPPSIPPVLPVNPDPPSVPVIPASPTSPGDSPTTPSNPPASDDKTPPLVQIYSPSMSATATSKASLTIDGFATDNVGVTRILWTNSAGGGGSVSVANPFVISGVALVPGVNRIRIDAYDAAGNVGSAYLTVTRK